MTNGITRNAGFFLLMIGVLSLLGVALVRYFETAQAEIDAINAVEMTGQETKREYTALLHEKLGGAMNKVVDGNMSVDILTPTRAIEVVWSEDSLTGVGRGIYLGVKANRPPLVILLSRNADWLGQVKKVEASGVECWVYSTEKKMFLYGGPAIKWSP